MVHAPPGTFTLLLRRLPPLPLEAANLLRVIHELINIMHIPQIPATQEISSAMSPASGSAITSAMIRLRLTCSAFWVDVRLREINGRWIASADTPDGPSLGVGQRAIDAIEGALAPFEGIVDDLLASLPCGGLG